MTLFEGKTFSLAERCIVYATQRLIAVRGQTSCCEYAPKFSHSLGELETC